MDIFIMGQSFKTKQRCQEDGDPNLEWLDPTNPGSFYKVATDFAWHLPMTEKLKRIPSYYILKQYSRWCGPDWR